MTTHPTKLSHVHTAASLAQRRDALLAEAGSDKDHLLNATIYLKDIGSGFAPMNDVWSAWLSPGMAPTRTTLQAELARPNVLVEISVIAVRK